MVTGNMRYLHTQLTNMNVKPVRVCQYYRTEGGSNDETDESVIRIGEVNMVINLAQNFSSYIFSAPLSSFCHSDKCLSSHISFQILIWFHKTAFQVATLRQLPCTATRWHCPSRLWVYSLRTWPHLILLCKCLNFRGKLQVGVDLLYL